MALASIFNEEVLKYLQGKTIYKDLSEEDDDEQDGDDDDDDDDDAESNFKVKFRKFLRDSGRIRVRVHDILIEGNYWTNDSLLEEEAEVMRNATTVEELIRAAHAANVRFQRLGIFDSVRVLAQSGPPWLPGTANVLIEVVEAKSPITVGLNIFSIPDDELLIKSESWLLEGSVKLKNLFGYGDIWDGSWAHGWGQTGVISTGVSLPRFKWTSAPLMARISILPQNWLKLSSYEEHSLGLSVGLISTEYHDLTYNLSWRDPSQIFSRSISSHLGDTLLSSLRYTIMNYNMDSPLRPTRGIAAAFTSQVNDLAPYSRSLQIAQVADLRFAFPLRVANAALNFGASVAWGIGFMDMASPLSELYSFGGTSPVWNFGATRSSVISPTALQRTTVGNSSDGSAASHKKGGRRVDLAMSAFVDLSFNLPWKLFKNSGIYGHLFVCAENLTKLTGEMQIYRESLRSSVGLGIIIPTNLFRMEVNYCCILKQLENDNGKTGIQFRFGSPSRSYHPQRPIS